MLEQEIQVNIQRYWVNFYHYTNLTPLLMQL